jgi:formate--tetrahydrofolate ligase
MDALKEGMANLDKHYENLKKYGVNVVVCLNKFNTDTDEEIDVVRKHCSEMNYPFAVSNAYALGSKGAMELVDEVMKCKKGDFHFLYDTEESIKDKINKVCKEIYGAKKVNYSKEILNEIKVFEKNKMDKLPICVAKTQYSLSDDAKKYGVPKDFEVVVKDIRLYGGAEFITVLLGDIMVMPGLSRRPNYELIDVVDGEIVNLS